MRIAEVPRLDLLARTAGLKASIPLPLDVLLPRLRGALAAPFPVFVAKDTGGKPNISMQSREVKVDKQRSVVISASSVSLVWASGTPVEDALKYLKSICEACEGAVPGFSQVLEHIDTEFFFDFKTDKNHYDLIRQTYYMPSVFGPLIEKPGRKALTNDIEYRVRIDDARVLVIHIVGTHAERAVIAGQLESERLRIRFGIGHTEPVQGSLYQRFEEHLQRAGALVEDELVELIVMPLVRQL